MGSIDLDTLFPLLFHEHYIDDSGAAALECPSSQHRFRSALSPPSPLKLPRPRLARVLECLSSLQETPDVAARRITAPAEQVVRCIVSSASSVTASPSYAYAASETSETSLPATSGAAVAAEARCQCAVVHSMTCAEDLAKAHALIGVGSFYARDWVRAYAARMTAGVIDADVGIRFEVLSFEPPPRFVGRLYTLAKMFADTAARALADAGDGAGEGTGSDGAGAVGRPIPPLPDGDCGGPSNGALLDWAAWDVELFDPLDDVYGRSGAVQFAAGSLDPRIFPGDPESEAVFLYEWGKVYVLLREYTLAIRFMNLALSFNPRLLMALSRRGFCHSRLEEYQEAVKDCTAGLAIADARHVYVRSILHYNLGIALQNVERNDESIVSYNASLALAPDMVDAYCNRAITAESLGRYSETRDDYTRALRLDPCDRGVLLWRAEMYRDVGNVPLAISDVVSALAMNSAFVYKDVFSFVAYARRQTLTISQSPASLTEAVVDAAVAAPFKHPGVWDAWLSGAVPPGTYDTLATHILAGVVQAPSAAARLHAADLIAQTEPPPSALLYAWLTMAVLLEPVPGVRLRVAGLMACHLLEHAELDEPRYTSNDLVESRTLESSADRLGVVWATASEPRPEGDVCSECGDAACPAPGPRSIHALLHNSTSGHWRLFKGRFIERWGPTLIVALLDALSYAFSPVDILCYLCGSVDHATFHCNRCAYCGENHWVGSRDVTASTRVAMSDLPFCTKIPRASARACVYMANAVDSIPPVLTSQHPALAALISGDDPEAVWTPDAKVLAGWSIIVALVVHPHTALPDELVTNMVGSLGEMLKSPSRSVVLTAVVVIHTLLVRPGKSPTANTNLTAQRQIMSSMIESGFTSSLPSSPRFDQFATALEENIAINQSVDHVAGSDPDFAAVLLAESHLHDLIAGFDPSVSVPDASSTGSTR